MTQITAIESIRRDLAMADAGYDWKPDPEHVGALLREYDRLSARPASAGVEEMVRAATAALCADAGGAGLSDCSGDCVCYRDAHTAVTAALAARCDCNGSNGMTPHPVIWLQPWCQACDATEDRTWCQDNVWEGGCEECGEMPVKYVLAPDQPHKPDVTAMGTKL